ncbi:MAG TPA: hypothetical protein VHG72_17065 [Polyangia bacterium]|nr:hypothetical protein [Polyangia bacterium]
MRTSFRTAVFASAFAVFPACAGLQPVQRVAVANPPGPVAVSVLREGCSQNVDPQWPGADLVEATVEARVSNQTGDALVVRRDGFRLMAPDGRELRTSTWGADQPIALGAGQSQTFQLRFDDRGGLSCSGEMRLAAPAAVMKGGEVVQVAAVSFRPSGA